MGEDHTPLTHKILFIANGDVPLIPVSIIWSPTVKVWFGANCTFVTAFGHACGAVYKSDHTPGLPLVYVIYLM